MKIEIIEERPTPPPKTVVLTLTEEEACLIYCGMNYYATSIAAAERCANKLKQFSNKAVYPYTNAFKD